MFWSYSVSHCASMSFIFHYNIWSGRSHHSIVCIINSCHCVFLLNDLSHILLPIVFKSIFTSLHEHLVSICIFEHMQRWCIPKEDAYSSGQLVLSRERMRSDSVLWQKALFQQKKVTTQKNHQNIRLQSDCGPI